MHNMWFGILCVLLGAFIAWAGLPRGYSRGGYDIQTSGDMALMLIGTLFIIISGIIMLSA